MHIENFKVFCDLVESKSFSRAAKQNNITQSAVSQQLRTIEEQVKSIIVDRSQKQFRLTPEGGIFYDAARDILKRYEQLSSDIQASKNIISGQIRISTIYSIGLHELPPFIKKFLHEYPSVNVRVEYRHCSSVYEDVAQNVADLGFVAFPQRSRQVEVIDFMEDHLVLICAPTHPLASQKLVQAKDLEKCHLIGFSPEIPTRKATDCFLREARMDLEPTVEFDNIETMKRAVEIDAGVALVPSTTITQEVKLGTLVALEVKGKSLVRPIGILYRKGRVLTPPLKKFIEMLVGKK